MIFVDIFLTPPLQAMTERERRREKKREEERRREKKREEERRREKKRERERDP